MARACGWQWVSDPGDWKEGTERSSSTQDAPEPLPSLCLVQGIPLLASAAPKALPTCMEPLGGLYLAPAQQQQREQSGREAGESWVAPEGSGSVTGRETQHLKALHSRH